MRVADLHVDVLCKMLENPGAKWGSEPSADKFDATPDRLREGGIALQVFALYLPDEISAEPENVFRAAELFWSEVLTVPGMKLIRRASDLEACLYDGRIGALLSLEGVDGLQGKWWALRLLHRLGLRLLGPTWNHANWACDGAMEPRDGGLTKAGRKLIEQCASLGIIVDASHLSDRGFWDVAETTRKPFIASHSNARALKNHPRNLTDEQIEALVAAEGLIGLTFVPWFLTETEPATISDVLRHVEHVCSLGGAERIAFGSDFDGISRHPAGLEHPGLYPSLTEQLLKKYPENLVRGFMSENAIRFFTKNLPD